ncbi:MAG: integrase arm-type DNA-binding domain-containing protein, partial [Desulforhopalus sp.]
MPLTDTAIRNAKPEEKAYKLTDSRGLYLVNKTGKYFRWDYRFAGKRKTYSLGVYPDVKLKDVREKQEDLRRLLIQGIDPIDFKKDIKAKLHAETLNSFETVAREWFYKNKSIWTEKHSQTIIGRLEKNVFPWIGQVGIADISALAEGRSPNMSYAVHVEHLFLLNVYEHSFNQLRQRFHPANNKE